MRLTAARCCAVCGFRMSFVLTACRYSCISTLAKPRPLWPEMFNTTRLDFGMKVPANRTSSKSAITKFVFRIRSSLASRRSATVRSLGDPLREISCRAPNTDSGEPLTRPKRFASELLYARAAPVALTFSSLRLKRASTSELMSNLRARATTSLSASLVVAARASACNALAASAPTTRRAWVGVGVVARVVGGGNHPAATSSRRICCP